jgi:hypothetical protein
MYPETITIQGPSILELLGIYPAVLALLAVILGIASLVVRKSKMNLVAGIGIIALSFLGLGATAWRLFSFNGLVLENSMADPSQWLRDFGISWMAAGVVLPACAIGLFLLALACILTKPSQYKESEAQQAAT